MKNLLFKTSKDAPIIYRVLEVYERDEVIAGVSVRLTMVAALILDISGELTKKSLDKLATIEHMSISNVGYWVDEEALTKAADEEVEKALEISTSGMSFLCSACKEPLVNTKKGFCCNNMACMECGKVQKEREATSPQDPFCLACGMEKMPDNKGGYDCVNRKCSNFIS